jgi:membrane protein DedA with SNARE-associated domain
VLYVGLGYTFSDRVQYLAEILGNLAWVILGVIVTLILGWKVMRYFRPAKKAEEETTRFEPVTQET